MMALWARTGTARRCLRSHSQHVVHLGFLGSSDRQCGVARAQHAKESTRAALDNSGSNSISPEHWKSVYRAFLLHVHPDFFHDQPKERAVNEKSLKVLSMHLDDPGDRLASKGACLVFFFKTAAAVMDHKNAHDHSNDGHSFAGSIDPKGEERPLPRKVVLPIASDRNSTKIEVRHLLDIAGVSSTTPTPSPHKTSRHQKSRSAPTGSNEDSPEWNDWEEGLFGDTPANRDWDEAAARAGRGRGRDGDTTSEGRHRTTGGGAASEEYEHSGGAGLGRIVSTDAGRALVRERRVSARNVRRLVEELREKHGFGKFTFRCGWSKSNLVVALSSLVIECDVHRNAFHVPNFGGLDVVFREDPSVLHKGEIRLCPADVTAQWISVLRGVTPALLSEVEERSREVSLLEEEASAILQGARLSRGLSCSKSRYHEFLGSVCMAGTDAGMEGEATADFSRRDWSVLQCRVEEGFSRVSKVLDDGTIQIGSGMTLQTVRQCLEKNFASSAAAVSDTAHLTAAVAIATARCRQSLGLEAIDRTRTVSVGQMAAACEALVSLGEGEHGDVLGEATAARRRLRGHRVRVVGARRGVFDGVTEDGEVAVPWNWAEEGEQERRGASRARRPPSPFC